MMIAAKNDKIHNFAIVKKFFLTLSKRATNRTLKNATDNLQYTESKRPIGYYIQEKL